MIFLFTCPPLLPVGKERLQQWVWRPTFLVWLHGSEATVDLVLKILWKYVFLKFCVLTFQKLPEGQAQMLTLFFLLLPGAGAVFLRAALVPSEHLEMPTTYACLVWGQQIWRSDRPSVRRRISERLLQEWGLRTTITYTRESRSADCMPRPGYMLRKGRRGPRWVPGIWRRWQNRELQAVGLVWKDYSSSEQWE